jgi:imidazole glycerol-phosphate synthase subunit HisH
VSASPVVVVLDYGSGNLRSAQRALERVGADVVVTSDLDPVGRCDGLVVPGVGAFAECGAALDVIQGHRHIERRLAGARPVLGVCVGLQLMFEEGVEHGIRTPGFAQWPGVVERLPAPVVPHMGWNTVDPAPNSALFAGVESERFYFVHSYAVQHWDFRVDGTHRAPPRVSWSHHGTDFIAAVEDGPLSAVQFHPEKSGDAGLALLENWLRTL